MSGAERRVDTATVLFTDVVGSTSQRARIGEEAADRLRQAHDAFVNSAIQTNRGVVVKHTGDGVMATFSAAVDAVGAAVAIQQAVDLHNRRGETEPIEVRIGISVGDVTFEGDDCFGLPVVEAQRLESAAEPGGILCADIVRHLARGRGGFEFTEHGDLELKGIPGTVPTAAVHWEALAEPTRGAVDQAPMPPALSSPSTFPLAGRSEVFDQLVAEWKESATGSRRVVLLAGEPGVGKTRLATELALTARDQNALVLAGRCDEDLGLAFQPFVEALRFQLELADDVAPVGWLGAFAGELVRLVPEVADRVPGAEPRRGDAESERARLFEAVTAWLRTTAAGAPLLLVLDDLHWADPPTLALFRHLVHETANDRVMILGTYRDTDLDRSHPLAAALAEFRRLGAVQRIAIDGLDRDGVAQFLERSAGHDLDDAGLALADAVFAETNGNPFFVGEIMRNLVESGALVVRDGRWTSDLTLAEVGLPEGVREVVGRRISRLDESTQRSLSVAAVIGAEFDVRVLADVVGIDEDDALDQLDRARATGLLNEVGLDRYRFGHALVRTTLLEELTTTRRIRTHRKIAEALESRHGADPTRVLSELAYHFGEASAAGVADKAVEYAGRAGDAAMDASAPDDAIRWYSLALEHLEDDDIDVATEVDLLTRLARAQQQTALGDVRDTVVRAATIARNHGLAEPMAEALLVSGRTSFDQDQPSDPEKIELLEHALTVLDEASALRARVLGALSVELIFVGDTRRFALLDDALAAARASGDRVALIEVGVARFNARSRKTWHGDAFRREAELQRELWAAADSLDDPMSMTSAWLGSGFHAMVSGDGPGTRTALAALEALAAVGSGAVIDRAVLMIGEMVAASDGELVVAEARSAELFKLLSAMGIPEAITYRATMGFAGRREQDRLAELLPDWTEFRDARPQVFDATDAAVMYMLATTGEIDEAARLLDRAAANEFAAVPDDAGWPMAIALYAETAALVADRHAAAILADIIGPFAAIRVQLGTGGIMCGPATRLVARLEAVLGDDDGSDRSFAAAVEDADRLESPIWRARCRLDWAEQLLSRAEVDRARVLIDEAEAAIGELDVPAVRRQLSELRD